MSDARKMILNMLSEGKITVEESEKLLAAINEKEAPREEPKDENRQQARDNDQNTRNGENSERGRDERGRSDAEQVDPVEGVDQLVLGECLGPRFDVDARLAEPPDAVGMDVFDQERFHVPSV